jgi:hypothetical protein
MPDVTEVLHDQAKAPWEPSRALGLAGLDPAIEVQPRRVIKFHDTRDAITLRPYRRPQAVKPQPGVAGCSRRLSPGHRPVPQTMTRFAQNQQRTVLLTVGRTGCGNCRAANQRDAAWHRFLDTV